MKVSVDVCSSQILCVCMAIVYYSITLGIERAKKTLQEENEQLRSKFSVVLDLEHAKKTFKENEQLCSDLEDKSTI